MEKIEQLDYNMGILSSLDAASKRQSLERQAGAAKEVDAMTKCNGGVVNKLEEMAASFLTSFKNMDDINYRLYGKAYLQHQLKGVHTGRFYAAKEGRDLTKSDDELCVNYSSLTNRCFSFISDGYGISDVVMLVLNFFNTDSIGKITYSDASAIARRLFDAFYRSSVVAGNEFWGRMTLSQLFIKHAHNPDQHVGYTSDDDLRGLSINVSRQLTYRTKDADALMNGIMAAYAKV